MTMTALWAFNKAHYWMPVGLIVAVIYILVSSLTAGSVSPVATTQTDCSAFVTQIQNMQADIDAEARFSGSLLIGAGDPRPSTQVGCPDCTACPSIALKFDGRSGSRGSGSGGAAQKSGVSGTAKAGSGVKIPSFSVNVGGGGSIDSDVDPYAEIELGYKAFKVEAIRTKSGITYVGGTYTIYRR